MTKADEVESKSQKWQAFFESEAYQELIKDYPETFVRETVSSFVKKINQDNQITVENWRESLVGGGIQYFYELTEGDAGEWERIPGTFDSVIAFSKWVANHLAFDLTVDNVDEAVTLGFDRAFVNGYQLRDDYRTVNRDNMRAHAYGLVDRYWLKFLPDLFEEMKGSFSRDVEDKLYSRLIDLIQSLLIVNQRIDYSKLTFEDFSKGLEALFKTTNPDRTVRVRGELVFVRRFTTWLIRHSKITITLDELQRAYQADWIKKLTIKKNRSFQAYVKLLQDEWNGGF